MKPEELRIGNIVRNGGSDKATRVVGIRIKKDRKIIHYGNEDLGDVAKDHIGKDGVPITKEWLVRFGFEKRADNVYLLREWIKASAEDNDWADPVIDICMDEKYLTCISYVHQLQNLYFALVGNELELDEIPETEGTKFDE